MGIKSKRIKAVRLAWENERKLVLEGKGTRDWTPEQQRQIIEIGKALDEDGEAFEGHHMKNVNDYPEFAGNPENIQFLTRPEHKEAHKGSWGNLTNWYYNPETGEYKEFAPDTLEPCEPFKLKEPVAKTNDADQSDSSLSEEAERTIHFGQEKETEKTTYLDDKEDIDERSVKPHHSVGYYYTKKPQKLSGLKKVTHGIGNFFKAIGEFTEKHSFAIGITLDIVNTAIGMGFEKRNRNVVDIDRLDRDFPGNEPSTSSNTKPEVENTINIDNKTGHGAGTPKSPHFRNGFPRKLKAGLDDEGNMTYKYTSVRSTYVHKDQIENNNDD